MRVPACSLSFVAQGLSSGLLFCVLAACGDGPITPADETNAFNPIVDTALEGTHEFDTVNIPHSVTVTATGSLTLNVAGDVVIRGALVGDCVTVTVKSGSTATIGGTISNACSTLPPMRPPPLTIMAEGSFTLEDAWIVSSGDVLLRDASPVTVERLTLAGEVVPSALTRVLDRNCSLLNSTIEMNPEQARRGRRFGDIGGTAFPGRGISVECHSGLLSMFGGVTLRAQHGGDGASGHKMTGGQALAAGGRGGPGGDILLLGHGIEFLRDNTLRSGDGGNGGSGSADGEQTRADGSKAADALARGGDGGPPGRIIFETGTVEGPKVSVRGGTLEITVGMGGDGGQANAIPADGLDATDTEPAQAGGDAHAVGGDGGGSHPTHFSSPPITILDGEITIRGGDGGDGGNAFAQEGNGGNGSIAFPGGADAGTLSAEGGTGGDGELEGLDGSAIGVGGEGGEALFDFANGGDGWSDCLPAQPTASGGNGGRGGDAIGSDGIGGTGRENGKAGGIAFFEMGIGGAGGNGEPPGAGGEPGTDRTVLHGIKFRTFPPRDNFSPGPAGVPCSGVGTVSPAT